MFDPHDAPSPKGWSRRRAAAIANRQDREDALSDPLNRAVAAARLANIELDKAVNAAAAAEEHEAMLQAGFDEMKARAARIEAETYRTGLPSDSLPALKGRIGQMPALMKRAKAETAQAYSDVTDRRRRLAQRQDEVTALEAAL